MKITDLRSHILFNGWRNLVFVEVETDAGIIGLGEATLANRTEAVVAYLNAAKKKHVVGSDPFDIEALWRRIYMGDTCPTRSCARLTGRAATRSI